MMNDAADSPDDSRIFETFMRYPAPLAVVDLQGRIELTNKAFADYLRRGDIDPKSLMALSGEGHTGDGTWRHLPARDAGVAPVCRARAVRTRQRILVVVQAIGDDGEASAGDSFELRLEELAHLAPTDPVTGAWTRAHVDHVIGAEIARSDTSRSALSLVLIGVDSHAHIRQANGPAASDALLRELVGLLKARMRSSDLLFRRDEQTFVALASSAGYQGAQIMAETLRRAVAEQGFDSGQTLTVSAAVAEHLEGESVQAWFGRLDRLLDEARNAGGNRVAVDRHGMQPGTAGHAASLHLVWHPDCESGNALIDREHRQLYDLANAVIDAALAWIGKQRKP